MDPDAAEEQAESQRKQRILSGMEQTRNRWIRRQVAEMKQMPSSSWSEAMQTAAAGNNYQAVRAIFRTTYAKLPLRDRLAEAQATLAESRSWSRQASPLTRRVKTSAVALALAAPKEVATRRRRGQCGGKGT